jgi:hypothetical protein
MRKNPDDYKVLAFLPTARQTQFSAAVMTQMGLQAGAYTRPLLSST